MMEDENILKWPIPGREGKKEDLPYELRKMIYDECMKIDLKEHDDYFRKLHNEGKDGYAAGYKSDIPGLSFLIGPPGEEIIVLINVLVQETGEKNVMALKFRVGEEHTLIPEDFNNRRR